MSSIQMYLLPLRPIPVYADDLVQPDPGRPRSQRQVEIPTWALYIDHPQGKVLFDTGERYADDRTRPYDLLVEQLALCGVQPEQIDYLVLSHLHYDHAGKIDLFTKAQVTVQRQELEEALYQSHVVDPNGVYRQEDLDAVKAWRPVEGELELLPGIRLIPLPGHSAGLQGMEITLPESGRWLITSDACYTAENYGPPAKLPGVLYDTDTYQASLQKIHRLAQQGPVTLMFGHDPVQFARWRKAPDCYR